MFKFGSPARNDIAARIKNAIKRQGVFPAGDGCPDCINCEIFNTKMIKQRLCQLKIANKSNPFPLTQHFKFVFFRDSGAISKKEPLIRAGIWLANFLPPISVCSGARLAQW